MRLFGFEIRKASKREIATAVAWGHNPVRLASRHNAMLLSTVYRCVDLISDSLAVLPCQVFRLDGEGFKTPEGGHAASRLLRIEPSGDMTAYTFFKTMVASMLLRGNAYAYIERGRDLRIESLVFLPPSHVDLTWVTGKDGIPRKRYSVTGFKELVEPFDMLHVLNFSYDGQKGVSTLEHARQTLRLATESEEHAAAFFSPGGKTTGVLTVEGRLSKDQKDQIYEQWANRVGNGGMAVLEGNMRYQPISISPKDSQLLESREFNVIDICRFFGVSPVKAFDLTKSSYSTVEATQIEYLTDTVQPIIRRFEDELNRKLFLPSERGKYEINFDTSALLRTNKAEQSAFLRDLAYIGSYTPNEVRREIGLPRIDGGDEALVQVNMTKLKDVGNQGGEGVKTDPQEGQKTAIPEG